MFQGKSNLVAGKTSIGLINGETKLVVVDAECGFVDLVRDVKLW